MRRRQQRGASHNHRAGQARAIVLTAQQHGKQVVVRCCPRALSAGVQPGFTLAHARALLPIDGLIVDDFDPHHDTQALRALAKWAGRFSPTIAIDLPFPPGEGPGEGERSDASTRATNTNPKRRDTRQLAQNIPLSPYDNAGLLMDITGCARLFKGERNLAGRLHTALSHFGFTARIAIAPTFGSAWAAARFAPDNPAIIGENDLDDAIAPLPIEGLRIDETTRDALLEVGIDCIEHVLAQPRDALVKRFGDDLLLRIDQLTGNAMEMLEPIRPAPPLRVERAFAGPVKQIEAITLTVRDLLAALAEKLHECESGVRQLLVVFERIDAGDVKLSVSLSRPNREVKHLWSLLSPQVEKINLGFGVERIALIAKKTGRLPHRQLRVEHTGDASPAAHMTDVAATRREAGQLIDVLAHRLTDRHLCRALLSESHLPEHTARYAPLAQITRDALRASQRARSMQNDHPTWLLEKPEPIEIMAISPDGPPQWCRWRGDEHRIIAARGPRRLSPQWWHSSHQRRTRRAPPVSPAAGRDYYIIQNERGQWLWIYRELNRRTPTPKWFVHGRWM